ncbi:MAG: ISKra4 family transposase [Lewinellaceae bacterium]|nr:ISKra4 family transposase [Lewinellaceae bacterium]
MEKQQLTQQLKQKFEELVALSDRYIESSDAMHDIEKGLLSQLLSIGLLLLRYIIAGKLKQSKSYEFALDTQVGCQSKGKKERRYLSLFGPLSIERPSHWASGRGIIYKLDEYLQLPRGSYWSYNIQELVGESASENDFRESVHLFNKLLNLDLRWESSVRNTMHLGQYVEAYYKANPAKAESEEVCFSASFDGKGVPKVKKPKTCSGNPKARRGKGEKPGTKQMATVSVTSSFKPKQRSVEAIADALMGVENKQKKVKKKPKQEQCSKENGWHKNIHRRAFLADQDKAVDYGIRDIKNRIGHADSRFIVPIDAGIGLEEKVRDAVKKYELENAFDGIILNIIHVLEYVWAAATAVFGEQSKSRTPWVRDMLTDLLNSKTQKVIDDLVAIRDKTKLSKSKRKQVNKAITYFSNHQHKMGYLAFIEKGYPISSAMAESTCGYLVKERMEQSGMRWSSRGAQKVMDLRAVKLNGDMEDFMRFVIGSERKISLRKMAA